MKKQLLLLLSLFAPGIIYPATAAADVKVQVANTAASQIDPQLDAVITAAAIKKYEAFFQGYSKLSDAQRVQALNNFFLMINPDQVSRICIQSLCRAIKVLHDKDDLKATLIKQLLIPATWKKALIEENQALGKLFDAAKQLDATGKPIVQETHNEYLAGVIRLVAQVPESWPGDVAPGAVEELLPKVNHLLDEHVDAAEKAGKLIRNDEAHTAVTISFNAADQLHTRAHTCSYFDRLLWCILGRQHVDMLVKGWYKPKKSEMEQFVELVPECCRNEVVRFLKPTFPEHTNDSAPLCPEDKVVRDKTYEHDYQRMMSRYSWTKLHTHRNVFDATGLLAELSDVVASYVVHLGQSTEQLGKLADGDHGKLDLSGRGIAEIGDNIPNVSTIDLSDNLISQVSNADMHRLLEPEGRKPDGYFTGVLGLKNNLISELVDGCWLGGLQFLDVSNNRIRRIGKLIEVWNKLIFLNLSDNQITEISEGTLPLGMVGLMLRNNKLTKVPPDIYKMSALQTCMLEGNPFEPAELARFNEWWEARKKNEHSSAATPTMAFA